MSRIPRTLASLGDVLELEYRRDGKRYLLTYPRGYRRLCADPKREELWLIRHDDELDEVPLRESDEAAERLYRRWADFAPGVANPWRVTVRWPPEFKGDLTRIDYASDKWDGDVEEYTHTFGEPPVLERAGDIYRISGGTFRVTARGLT